jgi:hypothetical protein
MAGEHGDASRAAWLASYEDGRAATVALTARTSFRDSPMAHAAFGTMRLVRQVLHSNTVWSGCGTGAPTNGPWQIGQLGHGPSLESLIVRRCLSNQPAGCAQLHTAVARSSAILRPSCLATARTSTRWHCRKRPWLDPPEGVSRTEFRPAKWSHGDAPRCPLHRQAIRGSGSEPFRGRSSAAGGGRRSVPNSLSPVWRRRQSQVRQHRDWQCQPAAIDDCVWWMPALMDGREVDVSGGCAARAPMTTSRCAAARARVKRMEVARTAPVGTESRSG